MSHIKHFFDTGILEVEAAKGEIENTVSIQKSSVHFASEQTSVK